MKTLPLFFCAMLLFLTSCATIGDLERGLQAAVTSHQQAQSAAAELLAEIEHAQAEYDAARAAIEAAKAQNADPAQYVALAESSLQKLSALAARIPELEALQIAESKVGDAKRLLEERASLNEWLIFAAGLAGTVLGGGAIAFPKNKAISLLSEGAKILASTNKQVLDPAALQKVKDANFQAMPDKVRERLKSAGV